MNIEETAEKMRKLIEKIKKGFQDDSYSNESSISRQVVEPILRYLGWPTNDTDVVQYEYPLKRTRADIVLLHKGQPKVIIEVKRLGAAESAKEQLFQYAYHAGVSLAVLTTGKEWEFYLPMRPGAYQDRQVYKLDICARETEESVRGLMRYLFYLDLCSGKAEKMAEADHGDKTRDKDIQDALPKAWDKVLSECDERLMELLKDKVGDICGFTPDVDVDVVRTFIQKQTGNKVPHQSQKRPSSAVDIKRSAKPIESKNKKVKLKGFELYGKRHDQPNGIATLFAVFEELIRLDASFPDKFMQIHYRKKRRWLSDKQSDLYSGRCRQLTTGHSVSTDLTSLGIEEIIKAASGVARIEYGKDIKLLY